jgi:hypothetical protein
MGITELHNGRILMAISIKNVGQKKGVSCDPHKELDRLLKEHGTLVRQKNHKVYSVFGQTFVVSKSASDHRAALNRLTMLRRMIADNMPLAA